MRTVGARRMPPMTLVVTMLAVVLVVGAVACSDDEGAPIVAEFETSSTNPISGQLGDDDNDDIAPFVGEDPDLIIARFDQAVASQDLCRLADALDSSLPDESDPEGVVAVFVRMSDSVTAAVAFVPPELTEAWEAITTGTTQAAEAAQRSGGSLADPGLGAPFRTGSFEAALAELDRWVELNCT